MSDYIDIKRDIQHENQLPIQTGIREFDWQHLLPFIDPGAPIRHGRGERGYWVVAERGMNSARHKLQWFDDDLERGNRPASIERLTDLQGVIHKWIGVRFELVDQPGSMPYLWLEAKYFETLHNAAVEALSRTIRHES